MFYGVGNSSRGKSALPLFIEYLQSIDPSYNMEFEWQQPKNNKIFDQLTADSLNLGQFVSLFPGPFTGRIFPALFCFPNVLQRPFFPAVAKLIQCLVCLLQFGASPTFGWIQGPELFLIAQCAISLCQSCWALFEPYLDCPVFYRYNWNHHQSSCNALSSFG